MEDLNIKDKVVFVTGSARGIGFAIAKQYVLEHAKVVLNDINESDLKEAVGKLKKIDKRIIGLQADVTNEEQLCSALDKAVERFGSLDILINNAGLQYVSPIEDFPTDKFEWMIKVMLTAPFMAVKHVFPQMKKQGFGRIVNTASINGLIGFAGKAAYNSAKHGLIGLTKVAALEGALYNINVNAICPGYVDTELVRNQLVDLAKTRGVALEKVLEEVIYPLVPQKRLISKKEVANYVVFLTGNLASGITGQAVVIDGGYTTQ